MGEEKGHLNSKNSLLFEPAQVTVEVKNLPANAGDVRDMGLIPGSGGNGYPLHYSCLEKPKDTGDWKATVHRVTQSWI